MDSHENRARLSLLSLNQLTTEEIQILIDDASGAPNSEQPKGDSLRGKSHAILLFQGSSRTRAAVELASFQLGMNVSCVHSGWTRYGEGESLRDIVEIYAENYDFLSLRLPFEAGDSFYEYGAAHEKMREISKGLTKPLLSLSCDTYHPCQGLSDYLTVTENIGDIRGKKITFLWVPCPIKRGPSSINEDVLLFSRFGARIELAYPDEIGFDERVFKEASNNCEESNGSIRVADDRESGIRDSHIIYPRNWNINAHFAAQSESYNGLSQTDLRLASEGVKVIHCGPVFWGHEICGNLRGSPEMLISDQIANSPKAAQALMKFLWTN